jgi:nitrate/nitrite transporter NarK
LFFWGMFALSIVYPVSKMNNIPKHGTPPLPAGSDEGLTKCGKVWHFFSTSDLKYFAAMQVMGYFAALCVAVLFFVTNPTVLPMPGLIILRAFLLSMVAAAIAWMLINGCFVVGGGHIKERMKVQLDTEIFKDINTIFMTLLYIMTFGSFIGYANAFPTLITTVFKEDPANYAWMGATFGSLSRVVGGIIADFIGGALLTQIATTVQILATIIAGIIVRVAQGSDDTSDKFVPFVIFIVILFTATGVGNASTFKQMATLSKDDPERRGILLGFTAAVAAYGAFIIPTIFQATIKGGFLDDCFYIFALYYALCGIINYTFYLRKGAPFPC